MESPEIITNYYILLFVGIVAIGFHAYGLFSQRVIDTSHSAMHGDLDLLPVIMVAGKKDFSKGYLLYLITFEAIYIVMATSTTMLSFMLSLVDQEDTVGALSSQIKANAAIPVLASTALISLSQIKPFVHFENYIRDAFHGMSGVRTNARGVKGRIAFALDHIVKSLKIAELPASFDGKNSLIDSYWNKAFSVYTRLIEDGVDETKAKTFLRSYCKVQYLHEVTLGYAGISKWHREETNLVIEMFQSLDYELDAMEALIRDYLDPSVQDDFPEGSHVKAHDRKSGGESARFGKRWKTVTVQCVNLEQRLLLLLALLFINRPDAELDENSLLKDIMHQSVITSEQRLGNVLLSSLIAGLVASMFIFPMYKSLVDYTRSQISVSPYENKLPFATMRFSEAVKTGLPLGEMLFNGMNTEERQSANSSWIALANKIGGDIRYWAYEIVKPALIFFVSTGVTLAYRNRAIAQRSWNSELIKGQDNVPFLRYLSVGTYAYLATIFTIFLYYFIVLALIPSILAQIDFMTITGMEMLSATIPEIFYLSLIAFVISYFISYYCDFSSWNNDNVGAFRSIPMVRIFQAAALCGFLNWITKVTLGMVYIGWDMLGFFTLPFLSFSVFLATFAFFYRYYFDSSLLFFKPTESNAGIRGEILTESNSEKRAEIL